MRFPLAAVLSITAFAAANAAEPTIINLWPDKPPGYQVTSGPEKDTSTAESRGVDGQSVIRLGNVSRPQLHIYPAPKESRNGTAVVICPGGGFSILAWDLEGTEVAAWLNSLGITAAVLKYRVPTREAKIKWKPPVQDAQRAIRHLRSNAKKWAINPKQIGILGFSAGGCTAAMTAVAGEESLYKPIDKIDDISPRPNFQILVYPAYLVDKQGNLKPEVKVTKEAPPAFLVHAQNDPVTVKSSVKLFLALTNAGVPAALHVFQEGGHGYGLRPTEVPVTHWPELCEDWLRTRGLLDRK